MTFDEWWEDFVAEHDEWKYADSAALRRAAFQAGAASRDAEIARLKTVPMRYRRMAFNAQLQNEMELMQQQLAAKDALLKQNVLLREYLEKLACLGNGTRHGNSVGNALAIEALDATDKDLSGYILCDAKPVAWMRDAGEPSISTMSHCVPNSVKELWIKVNPRNVERYTVPLYNAKES